MTLTQHSTPIKTYILSSVMLLLLVTGCQTDERNKWSKLNSAESLWQQHPERLRTLLTGLDLSQSGLTAVKKHLDNGDTISAAEELASYYRKVNRDWVVTTRDPISTEDALVTAQLLLNDSIVIHEEKAKIPMIDGSWKWNFTGPSEDDEFGYSLNGHRYLMSLFIAWDSTNDDTYINKFDQIIKDWVINHPLPAQGDSIYVVLDPSKRIDWRDIGEVEWRTLEAGQRLGATWPQVFYGLHKEEALSDAGILLMLSSIADQANYLRQYHKSGHNWTTMEMNGLALAGLSFPEFGKSGDWADYALETMNTEINRQVYPDGIQTELSTKTQWVALRRFESIATNFQKADRKISPAYMDRIEEMYNYLAYCMRPDGHQPLNSDSDREDLRERILVAAKKFNRPDWEWVATNGKTGANPNQGPSLTFPWAGIQIARSGWDQNAHWSFFDFGAYGTGHQHRDKLHLSVSAFGEDILVDGGRYTHEDYFSFDPKIWRGYFRSSFSHNVILVNGKGQKDGPTIASAPLEEGVDYKHGSNYDYAYGTFHNGFEDVEAEVIHSRSILYIHDQFWVVMDNLKTDQPIDIQALWHYAPDREVKIEDKDAVSITESGPNLRIVPISDFAWEADIIKGQEEPYKQGWYSENYGTKEPNPTVIFSSKQRKSESFLWLLVPASGQVPQISTRTQKGDGVYHIEITREDKIINVTLPIGEDISSVNVSH